MNTKLNRSDFILLGIIIGVTSLFNVWQYYVYGNDPLEFIVDIPTYIVMAFIAIGLFMYWLLPNFLLKKTNYFLLISLAIIILTVTGFIENLAGYWSCENDCRTYPIWHRALLDGLFSGADNVGIPLGILLTKKFYESQTQVVEIQKQQKENELKLLRSQLDPHFLFNNLNTLDALIDSDTDKAKEYINRLSLIYRYLIQTKDAEVMELSKEMNLAENYIFLIQTRFGDDYDFHVNKNIDFSNKFLPTGAVQALLENVVKHNKVNGENKVHVVIDIDEDRLTVMNLKSNLTETKDSLGTGLLNLTARYRLLSKELPAIEESETEYKISIPIIKLSN
ncbi:Histidine kinase [Maribacter aquivivus]|uniref:Histidine kinase n=1 Tax=Maribacter aquivivus TaxID=228958 RepID=A0A1M6KCF4_9FLAO|nr:histidine kinase [Maribacter aquivivus]SHJ56604.1 Histidine kinase [Maribacter aquivivus]